MQPEHPAGPEDKAHEAAGDEADKEEDHLGHLKDRADIASIQSATTSSSTPR
jgi:hypothetical protein